MTGRYDAPLPGAAALAEWERTHDGDPDNQPPTAAQRHAWEVQDRLAARRHAQAIASGALVVDPTNPWDVPHPPEAS